MNITRQQRRSVERNEHRAWDRTFRQRRPWSGVRLEADDFLPYFADVHTADVVREAVDNCLVQMLGTAPIPEKGFAIGVRIAYMFGETRLILAPAGKRYCPPNHNSYIALLGFLDSSGTAVPAFRDTVIGAPQIAFSTFMNATQTELRLPFAILRDPDLLRKPYGNCWLYQIRFNTDQAVHEGKLNQQTFDMLGHGCFGVTRRPFAVRINEHFAEMKAGRGHLLHTVWRDLETRNIPHRVIAQLVAHSTNEDEIYKMEEQVVADASLAPLGLNMIPGGRAGIIFLRNLGVRNARFDNRDRLLADAINERDGTKPHYRSAHLREYKKGAFTMVTGHWVNAAALFNA
jgi:hypothetical protein